MPQVTTRITTVFRIGDPAGLYPIFDATGSTIAPGRWNTSACPIIYTSRYYSTALLEKLVHGSGMMPPNQHFIQITIPHNTSYEVFADKNPRNTGWDDLPASMSKIYGDDWCLQRRSLLLIVPSLAAREDQNILINPAHPDFNQLSAVGQITDHRPVVWDSRLFGSL